MGVVECAQREQAWFGQLGCYASPIDTPKFDALAADGLRYRFTGTLHGVTVDVRGDLIHDAEAELRAHMARQ